MKSITVTLAGLAAGAILLCACGSSASKGSPTTIAPHSSTTVGADTVVVKTTSDLQLVMTQLADAYTKAHPSEHVAVTTADRAPLTKSLTGTSPEIAVVPTIWLKPLGSKVHATPLGRQLAVIAVSSTNPHHVSSLQALSASSGLRTAVCGPKFQFGNLAEDILKAAHITANPYTVDEGCESRVLDLIRQGKLDAALMFRVGLKVPDGVKLVDFDPKKNLIIEYSYVDVGSSHHVDSFAQFLASSSARSILTAAGYLP